MREIKFRAWAFDDEFMVDETYNDDDFVFIADGGGIKLLEAKFDQINQSVSGYGECNHSIMQYTGLKDKNGVEIYEGDIVIMHTEWNGGFNSDDFGEHENIGVASITASRGVVLNKCKKKDIIECEESYKKTWSVNVRGYRSKVIGNIYENPELLECNNERG